MGGGGHLEEMPSRLVWKGWNWRLGAQGSQLGAGKDRFHAPLTFYHLHLPGHRTEKGPSLSIAQNHRTTVCWIWTGPLEVMELNIIYQGNWVPVMERVLPPSRELPTLTSKGWLGFWHHCYAGCVFQKWVTIAVPQPQDTTLDATNSVFQVVFHSPPQRCVIQIATEVLNMSLHPLSPVTLNSDLGLAWTVTQIHPEKTNNGFYQPIPPYM